MNAAPDPGHMQERFVSILFPDGQAPAEAGAPPYFHDLSLDRIVDAVTAGRQEYQLAPFFHAPLRDADTIVWRQEVMQDMEQESLLAAVTSFARHMQSMRRYLPEPERRYYRYQKERWLLDAAASYCAAVAGLAHDLSGLHLASRGMRALREHLARYCASPAFAELAAQTGSLSADLSAIRYCLQIDGSSITVRACHEEGDYSAEVERTFEKFRRGAAEDHRANLRNDDMNHVQEQVVKRVALFFPEVFGRLEQFPVQHASYLDETIVRFDREIQFYVAWLAYTGKLRQNGLAFCYPQLAAADREIFAHDTFDLALAGELAAENKAIVPNDFLLHGMERIVVVTGPNHGGKTTFARMFGQLHHLACLGCPVPGGAARLFPFDRLFTHFDKEEDAAALHGKLQDDLIRLRDILQLATPHSIVILNEVFSSTTVGDALLLGRKLLAKISALDALCVCVTFLDELASFDAKTVSIAGVVDPADPTARSFRLERKPPDGLAYALAIAEKHRVTYRWLKQRIAP